MAYDCIWKERTGVSFALKKRKKDDCSGQAPVWTPGVETERRERTWLPGPQRPAALRPGSLAARSRLLLTWSLQWSGKALLGLTESKRHGAQWTLTFQTLPPEAVSSAARGCARGPWPHHVLPVRRSRPGAKGSGHWAGQERCPGLVQGRSGWTWGGCALPTLSLGEGGWF